MKRVLLGCFAVVLGLASGLWAQGPKACADLTNFKMAGVNMAITKATIVPATAGAAPDAAQPFIYSGPLPAFCRADGVIDERVGVGGVKYGIRFAVGLPENWNHDFLQQGGGGLNGTVQPPVGANAAGDTPGLARGFAVVSTDTGHQSAQVFDGAFMADQQAFLDYAYVAIVRVSEAAKRIIAQYYGQPIGHSYYVGCSTGGREGMLLSQRYPLYFDGIVSGDPAMRTGFSTLGDRWAQVAFNQVAPKGPDGKPQAAFSEAEKKLIVDELLKQCDAKDGIADGLIFSSKGCEFDPGALACSAGRTGSCLAPEKTAALRKAFAGPKDSRGNQVYPGFPFDTGITTKGAMPGILDSRPGMLPTSTATQQDVDAEAAAAPNPLVDTAYTNLSTFSGSGHGGKLLFYHGMSDAWFSPWDTLEYYLNMAKQNGGLEKVEDWSRIYLVPGMGHCSGGEATLDSFDLLGAVQNWVEKGIAPDFVIAKGRSFPGRSRPLCAYPKFAHYKGQGDPEDASNFECRE